MRIFFALGLVCALGGCEPEDTTPGLWLDGELVEVLPDDWRFTRAHKEISIEVATPYFIPHSVTIWCAELNGSLYIAAGRADTKNWPGWVDDNPNVVLKIADRIYPARLQSLTDPSTVKSLQAVFAEKYDLPASSDDVNPTTRWWSVLSRI